MNVIDDPTVGARMGAALRTGIGSGIQALTDWKMNNMLAEREARGLLAAFPGMDPASAKALAGMSPETRNLYMKYKLQEYSPVGQQGIIQPEVDQAQAAQQAAQIDYLLGRSQPAEAVVRPATTRGIAQLQTQPITTTQPQPRIAQRLVQPQATPYQQRGLEQLLTGTSAVPEAITPKGTTPISETLKMPAKRVAKKAIRPTQLTAQEFQALQQRPVLLPEAGVAPKVSPAPAATRPIPSEKTVLAGYKANQKYLDEVSDKAAIARESNLTLGRMKELDKGEIMNPLYAAALDKLGLGGFKALKSKAAQEFEKLTKSFLRGAKAMFGARVTNFDLQQFMDTIPTISNTKEGRAAIIRNCELLNELAVSREKAVNDIAEENGGVYPVGLKLKVEQRLKPEYERIGRELISGDKIPQYEVGQSVKGLPKNPKLGMVITTKGGEDLEWNGKKWVKV